MTHSVDGLQMIYVHLNAFFCFVWATVALSRITSGGGTFEKIFQSLQKLAFFQML